MNKLRTLFYLTILLIASFLYFYFSFYNRKNAIDELKLKIKYEHLSKDTLQIYSNMAWNPISPTQILSTIFVYSGNNKEIDVNLPPEFTFSNLSLNFGHFDSTNIPVIKSIELNISGTKLLYNKSTLIYFLKNNKDYTIDGNGEIKPKQSNLIIDLIIQSTDLRPILLKYKSKTSFNTFNIILAGTFILGLFILSFLFYIKKIPIPAFFKKIPVGKKFFDMIFLIVFGGIMLDIMVYYSNNKINYMAAFEANDSIYKNDVLKLDSQFFSQFENNPRENLLYNGDFKNGLIFWQIYADSTTVEIIDTPYGNGVKVKRTDGDGGYWSLRYAGRPILYFSNHTYHVSFKCKVLKGNGIPFRIGWWVFDENKTHKPANLDKDITELKDGWILIKVKYKFIEKHQNPAFFMNSLQDYSELMVADIRLVDADYNPSLKYYSN